MIYKLKSTTFMMPFMASLGVFMMLFMASCGAPKGDTGQPGSNGINGVDGKEGSSCSVQKRGCEVVVVCEDGSEEVVKECKKHDRF